MNYQRIISLVPSLTELLIELGIGDRLMGRTRFCIHPEEQVKHIPIIGGTKNPRIDKILELRPDYVLANREENRKEDIETLRDEGIHVKLTEIDTIQDALMSIYELGQELEMKETAQSLIENIQKTLDDKPDFEPLRAAYFIWRKPWMVAASGTYIHEVLKTWNLTNIFGDRNRYPEINLKHLTDLKPELVLLSSEPYPFKETHMDEIREYLPDVPIELIDGEWFSWYGSRMLPSFRKLNSWRAGLE